MIDKKKLFGLILFNSKEVDCFPQYLKELDIFHDGKLAGDSPFVRALGAMHDDLFGRRNVGGEKDGRVNLRHYVGVRKLMHTT